MIFVNIAAYRDPECLPTVRDLFRKAKYPDQINVGAFLQTDVDDGLIFEHPRTRVLRINRHESKGACWARAQAYSLYDGEDYVLQIDSHMRFVQHWDEKMLRQLYDCRVGKPIISHYPPAYEPPDVLVGGYETGTVGAKEFDGMGMLTVQGLLLNPRPRFPKPCAFVGAGFIFGDARWVKEVPYDPYLYFWGEEPTLAARLWTHGWDMFAPTEPLVWHRYGRPDPAHWRDDPKWEILNTRSLHRMRHLFGLAKAPDDAMVDYDKYNLGTIRSLEEYERYIGVNYRQRLIEDRAKLADFPLPNRPRTASITALRLSPPMVMALEANVPMRVDSPEDLDWGVFRGATWGGDESISGPGSSLKATGRLRAALPTAFDQLAIRCLVDAPCGDMNWMRTVDYDFDRFIGVDLLETLITRLSTDPDFPPQYHFQIGNIVTDVLPTADALFCRDGLVHLPFAAIHESIQRWGQAGFQYVFVTTFPKQRVNMDVPLGGWRMLNMQLAPFYWPMPLMVLEDNDELEPPYESKSIGVWRLSDILSSY